jgi:hypothetical protein
MSARVRTGGWPTSHRTPSRISDRIRVLRGDRGTHLAGADLPDQQQRGGHDDGLGEERPRAAKGKKERADRRADQQLADNVASLQPRVGEPELVLVDQHRQQRPRGCVGKDVRDAEQQHCPQHPRDAHMPGQEPHCEHNDHEGPECFGADKQHAAVNAVRNHSRRQTQQQPGEPLQERGRCDQKRASCFRCDQQRPGRQGDAIADIANPRRRRKPAEVPPQSSRRESLKQGLHGRVRLYLAYRAPLTNASSDHLLLRLTATP